MALPAGRYGVTKNQLLKIKKLPMNTIKLIEDLYEKYSLLGSAAFKNSTSVVTESSDLVESGAVYTALQAQGVVGAQNLLEVTANSGESKGVTFTVDNEKEITCNGTTSGEGTFYIVGTGSTDLISIPEIWKGKRLRLTGCPSGGSDNSYRVRFAERSPNTIWHDDVGNGVEFILNSNTTAYNMHIQFIGNVDLTGKVFKPMITLADDPVTTFAPYAQTNRELTVNKCDNSVIGNVETAASSTHAYLVGQGFICDSQFRVAKGSGIAVGEQITDNNSDVKPIADCLIKQGTFSGTTDSSGLVEIYNGNRKVLKCESSVGNRIIIPYYSQTRSKVMARCMYEDGSVIASTAVSGTSYYID